MVAARAVDQDVHRPERRLLPFSILVFYVGVSVFLVGQLNPGETRLVHVNGKAVAVYNVAGQFFASQGNCTHAGGPLSEGFLEGNIITCPWHGSCFDVTDGQVTCGPATEPVKTYKVTVEGDLGRVEEG